MPHEVVVVVGLGEVGRPLLNILSQNYDCVGVDIQPIDLVGPCSVLHLCFPFQIQDFIGTACSYIRKYSPRFTVVNSTVAPGTTRLIEKLSGTSVAYSPIRGKHARMEADMLRYRKFVAAEQPSVADAVVRHYAAAGFKTDRFCSLETGELAKLLETTWLGVLVGWAQEVERLAAGFGATYADVNKFIEEIDFLPQVYPGLIGGHCVIPNIDILRSKLQSDFLDAIMTANHLKSDRLEVAIVNGDKE